jgi:hypothetical protein
MYYISNVRVDGGVLEVNRRERMGISFRKGPESGKGGGGIAVKHFFSKHIIYIFSAYTR